MLVFVISTWFLLSCFADVIPLNDEQSSRQKLVELLKKQGGSVGLDSSITNEIADQIYNKFKKIESSSGLSSGIPLGKVNKNVKREDDKHSQRRNLALTASGWEESDKQTVLDLHNSHRSNVASGNEADDGTDGTYPTAGDMNYLFWDEAIASVAQAYSDACVWGHNGNRNSEFYDYASSASFDYPDSSIYLGENIAIYYTTSSIIRDYYLTNRVGAWWNESTDWHYQAYSSSTINGAGHFTQMAWADTRYIGCGFSYCVDGSWNQYYLVCDYYPGGNYLNQYPYTESGTCSADTCDGDRTITCESSLCGGCMDPGYIKYGSTDSSTDCNNGFEDVDDAGTTDNGGSNSSSSTTSTYTYTSSSTSSNTDSSSTTSSSSSSINTTISNSSSSSSSSSTSSSSSGVIGSSSGSARHGQDYVGLLAILSISIWLHKVF